ncbi:helix-turn-helix domain-containing protein [Nocardia asiatica]|uniref:AraC family transcriptional regulator n=1 Tax=Nocardia asiatica TaxID=209252 RepID=UPI003EE2FD4B
MEVGLRIAEMTITPRDRSRNVSRLAKRDLGDVLISEWSSPSFDGHVATGTAPHPQSLLLLSVSDGTQAIETANTRLTLRAGALLLTTGQGATGRFYAPTDIRKLSVKVPVDALAPALGDVSLPALLLVETHRSPLARLLDDTLSSLAQTYEQMSPIEREVTRGVVINLIAGLLLSCRSDPDGRDRLRQIRAAAEKWIIDQLENGTSPRVDDAARALHVSARTIQRAFATTNDTVRGVARRRRIGEVKKDLLRTSLTLATLAHKWGYSDASHLTREFKDAVGETPGAFRRRLRSELD